MEVIPEQWTRSLTAKIEDSRKGKRDGEKGLSMPDPHVDGGKGKKVIVYNTKGENQEGGLENDSTRVCPRILFIQIYACNPFLRTL